MRTFISLVCVLTALLLAIVVPTLPVWAQADGFNETFDDPQLEEWERSPDVTVADGVLRVPPGNFALRFGDWSEVTLDVRVRRSQPGELFIHYYFRDESSYVLHVMEDTIFLERRAEDVSTELGQAALAGGQAADWLDLQVAVTDGQHTVSLNGESLFTASDPEPLPPGAILFQSMGDVVGEFDQLVVSGTMGGGPPMGGEEPPAGETPPDGEAGTEPVTEPSGGEMGGLFAEFFSSQASNTELGTFLINIALAVVTSYILGRVYIHWGSSLSNRRRFAANFMLMTVTTTFIILIVRSSVALSLGLVGALSIVRFRTAIKEPEELAYLFFAIALGIGLGDNQRLITLLAFAATIAILGLAKLFRRAQADVNLHLTVASRKPEPVDMEDVVAALKPHCAKLKLLRFDENDDVLEMAFVVEFKHMSDLSQAKAAIRELGDSVNMTFLDNTGIW